MLNEFYYTDLYRRAFQYAQGISSDIRIFTGALLVMMRDRIWERGWLDQVSGKRISTASLREFLEKPVPDGIGQTIEWTYAALKTASELGEGDAPQALQILDDQIKIETGETAAAIYARKVAQVIPASSPHGGDHGNQYTGGKRQGDNVTLPRRGNSRAHTLARLKRDYPELAQQVITGELSANAAAIKAGFRKKRRCPNCGHEL